MLLYDCSASEHPRVTVGPSVLACGQINRGDMNVPFKDSSLLHALHASCRSVLPSGLLCQEVDRKCTSLHLEIC